ncbi:serine/threonine protein kinase [Nannocystaceae bacterium ST9]
MNGTHAREVGPHPGLDTTPVSLGRQRLLFAIGHGGMSDVWLALISSAAGVDKLLVVKQLRASLLDDPEALAMFMDEARLASRLHHPNVVQTFEVGQEGPIPFMTMELLDGQPLHRIVRRLGVQAEATPLTLGMRLRIITEMLEGLHYAHELRDYDGSALQIVHRDVSPQNLFITYEGQIKVVDFGIAKAGDSITHSEGRRLEGKLAYMSPEQARGERVDRRTDVFAAGVMLWELLGGRRLWAGVHEAALIRRLIEGELPSLELPDVPAPLVAICRRALAADAVDRTPSAEALRLDIEQFIEREGVDASTRAIGKRVGQAFADERAAMRERIDRELLRLVGREGSTVTPLSLWQGVWREPETAERTLHSAIGTITRATPDEDTANYGPQIDAALAERERERDPTTNDASLRRWRALALPSAVLIASLVGLIVQATREPTPGTPSEPSEPAEHALAEPPPREQAGPQVPLVTGCDRPDKPVVDLTGDIDRDATLGCDREYLLRYETRVGPGVTLTIEPGTLLRGDRETKGLLLVQPGGRLIAEGTPERPIVFTSDRPLGEAAAGDWGGVLLLGRAPINLPHARVEGIERGGEFGGSDPDDDSGVLRHVRIEYAGMELAPNNELNGLTLAGVGRGTTIDHVQVRETTDDCFEFFGGTVDADHLICDDPGDDGFDFDLGYHGRLQHLVLRDRDPERPDPSAGNGIEIDSDPTGAGLEPRTRPVIANATLCGHPGARSPSFGILVRHAATAELEGLRIRGFDHALDLRDVGTSLTGAAIELIGQSPAELDETDDDQGFDERAWLAARSVVIDAGSPGCSDQDWLASAWVVSE